MTLLGKIFRPWDLAADESFEGKSNDEDCKVSEDEKEDDVPLRKSSSPVVNKMDSGDDEEDVDEKRIPSPFEKSESSNKRRISESSRVSSGSERSRRSERRIPPSISLTEELSNGRSNPVLPTSSHFLDLTPSSSSLSYFFPGSPVSTPSTASSFMSSSSINELASLSRSELTAMGLLPPEPPAAMKVKRQRPKRFRCPHCQVAFSNNGQLRGHIRIHTGERPFSCDHEGCGKSFTRNEELTRHRRIHTGLRPYPCTHCGKKFGRKDHLKKHTRTHQRPMYAHHPSSGLIGLGNPFHPFNPSLIPSPSAINDFPSTNSPYALPFMLSIPPPISHFPFS